MTGRQLPTVQRSISRVMDDVRAVGKGDYNEADGFAFRGIDAIVNAVGPALRRRGVVVAPTVQDVKVRTVQVGERAHEAPHVVVTVRYRWFGPAGDHIDCTTVGEAIDYGDKGVAKATAVAWRIALTQTLALPTDEPDPDASTFRRTKRDPDTSPWAIGMADLAARGRAAEAARDELGEFLTAEGIHPQEAVNRWAAAHPGEHINQSTDADAIRAMHDAWAAERSGS